MQPLCFSFPEEDIALSRLPTRVQPEDLLPRDPEGPGGPWEVEIGFGKGRYLLGRAVAEPENRFLGIEVVSKYQRMLSHRARRRSLQNLTVIRGEAVYLLSSVLPRAFARAVHVYFPDPWWKKRHHKRRVLNEAFLEQAVRTLRPGGRVHFWTDVREYYDATLELIAEHTRLEGPLDVPPTPAEHDLDYRTHFERRTRLADQPVYRSEFVKPTA